MPSQQENRLFLGNPGTGKRTLINCLTGRATFTSGLKFGGGLTQFFQKQIYNGVVYMDTPGLADRSIQRQAAEAITAALRESGRYKIFFMVRLKGGRVMSEDLATIEAVLDTVQVNDVYFSVTVNNVQKRQYATLMKKGPEYAKVVTIINSMKYTTPHIAFIPTIPELEEADNAFTTLRLKTEKELRNQINELETDNAALNRRMGKLKKKHRFFRNLGNFALMCWLSLPLSCFPRLS
ncbi:P-loop containing nucleoside triphosphate hydrolase [Phytophthora cactorum]|nr:P-loop containing nucleoside triphosphate hydrolase [Phytophthora cactorum]